MLSATCYNCGNPKTPRYYGENYCEDCTKAVSEARDKAEKAQTDLGIATREALAARAHDIHRNRTDPRMPFTRSDYWNKPPEGQPNGS